MSETREPLLPCDSPVMDITAFCDCGHIIAVHDRAGYCELCRLRAVAEAES